MKIDEETNTVEVEKPKEEDLPENYQTVKAESKSIINDKNSEEMEEEKYHI